MFKQVASQFSWGDLMFSLKKSNPKTIKAPFKTPILMAQDCDMSKQWFAFFRYKNHIGGSLIQKKVTNDYDGSRDQGIRIKHFKVFKKPTRYSESWVESY